MIGANLNAAIKRLIERLDTLESDLNALKAAWDAKNKAVDTKSASTLTLTSQKSGIDRPARSNRLAQMPMRARDGRIEESGGSE